SFVSRRGRRDVKVALIGQGPDELFGGYKRHLGIQYGSWWRRLPTSFRSMLGFAINGLSRNEMLKRGLSSLGTENRLKRYQDVFTLSSEATSQEIYRDRQLQEQENKRLAEYWRALMHQMEHIDEHDQYQLHETRS